MKSKPAPRTHWQPLVFTRADPKALAAFDPRTKQCTMNCGPHRDDPRTWQERQFLCPECQEVSADDNH
jgi:hypothetical protein